MRALPERWPLYAVLIAMMLTIVWSIVASLRRPGRMRARLQSDARDPFLRWMQGVFLIVSGDCDYAYLRTIEAVRLLARWWDIHGPVELRRVLDDLAGGGDSAWMLVRYVVVSRLGVGAGWLPPEEAVARARPIARRLQRAYESWQDMSWAYVLARRQAMGLPSDGSADDADMHAILDNIARLRDEVWNDCPFRGRWVEAS